MGGGHGGERERERGSEREVVRGGGSTERFRQIRRGIKQRE